MIFTAGAPAEIAKAYIEQLTAAGVYGRKSITTQVTPLVAFYEAEKYHQDYAVRNPMQPYIVINDLPKIDNLKRGFPDLYRAEPVLVLGKQAA